MARNETEHAHGTLLIAAVLFACAALAVLSLVWYWPQLFGNGARSTESRFIAATEEEKEAIRAQMRINMESDKKEAVGGANEEVRMQVQSEIAASESDVPESRKDNIRAQLRAQTP